MRQKIMVIDDIQINLDMLEGILEDTYDVILAGSGPEALLKLAEGANPDLILLDLSMPGMDGFEVLERIMQNKEYAGIPVIFVTGEHESHHEEKGLRLGAVDYIKKPYVPNIILVKIKNHIELKILRDNLSAAVATRTKQLEESTQELYATHRAVILGMSLLSESRDKVTGSHLLRIEFLTSILAKKISEKHPEILSDEMVELISMYSPLHDVGKVGVSDSILNKQGKLTEEEFEQMKFHAKEGGNLLRQIAGFLPSERSPLHCAIEIAQYHHERFDGTGYPNNISGESIPLAARIVTVADIYDALRSPRPYKPPFTHEQAIDIILNGDGRTDPSHFDPIVLEAFKETHEALRDAYDNNPDPHIEK
ncbi:MAG: response regulator [Defluviitaleaceae bacterium]|nr:response regulator [Defluviitaleaceae bacterium]